MSRGGLTSWINDIITDEGNVRQKGSKRHCGVCFPSFKDEMDVLAAFSMTRKMITWQAGS